MAKKQTGPASNPRGPFTHAGSRKQERKGPAADSKAPETLPADAPRPSRALVALLCLVLALATLAVYAQAYRFGFIVYDDDRYIYDNPMLKQGLTPSGVSWAFTTFYCSNWHPLTWLSHLLDCQLFGLNAGAHHLVNVGFHLANSLLLFIAFVRMTRRPWASALVAGVFAVHPLHVESVAWVSERKDVLSTFLGLVTLLFYIRYTRKPTVRTYIPVALTFALALIAKPMLVTFPFVLLLLDIWPLRRLAWPPPWRALRPKLWEKAPLFALAAGGSVSTFVAQQITGAVQPLYNLPFFDRVANASAGYVSYVAKAFWPARLGVLYPIHTVPAWSAVGAAVILLGATLAAFALGKKRPYLLVGWLWYLGMLVPVIGIVQVGSQSIADRYAYLPLVGLSFAIIWLAAELVGRRRLLKRTAAAVACVALMSLAAQAYRQAAYWKSSRELFEHTLAVTDKNAFIHNNLGVFHFQEGRYDDAIAQFRQAAAVAPTYAEAHNNQGMVLVKLQRTDEAMGQYQAALAINPGYAEAHNNLGVILAQKGRFDDAATHYRKALAVDPDYADAHANLGHELLRLGKLDESFLHLAKAVQTLSKHAEVQADLGTLLAAQGKLDESRSHLEESLAIAPDRPDVHSNLGFVLQRLGRIDDAIVHYTEALRLKPDSVDAHYNMAVALAAQGKKAEAEAEFSKVLALYPAHQAARTALEQLRQSR